MDFYACGVKSWFFYIFIVHSWKHSRLNELALTAPWNLVSTLPYPLTPFHGLRIINHSIVVYCIYKYFDPLHAHANIAPHLFIHHLIQPGHSSHTLHTLTSLHNTPWRNLNQEKMTLSCSFRAKERGGGLFTVSLTNDTYGNQQREGGGV